MNMIWLFGSLILCGLWLIIGPISAGIQEMDFDDTVPYILIGAVILAMWPIALPIAVLAGGGWCLYQLGRKIDKKFLAPRRPKQW